MDSGPAPLFEDFQQCEILWTFNAIRKPVIDPEVIIVLGSNDLSVARFAAHLALRNAQTFLVCSGGVAHHGDLLDTGWGEPEADIFANAAQSVGLPANRILKERRSTNTGENIALSRELLNARNLLPERILIVQKPYMCLRAWLTARWHWPTHQLGVDHEQIKFMDYYERIGRISLIDIIVGDTQRIIDYPKLGYFEPVSIPRSVLEALQYLITRGYTGHLPR